MRSSFLTLLLPVLLFSHPHGENVVSGEVRFSRDVELLEAHQRTDKAVIEWSDFSIGAGETVRFVQPEVSSSVLNRVVGGNLSAIYGKLEANGKVLLINPQGILFGKSGRIDVAAFLASTLDLAEAPFLEGRDLAFSGQGGGKIVYEGEGIAREGNFILIAPAIEGSGSIANPRGKSWILETEGVLIRAFEGERWREEPVYSLAVHAERGLEARAIKKVGGRVFLDDERVAERTLWDHHLLESILLGLPFGSEPSIRALQQIRTVIPERLWMQEFCLLFNRKALKGPVQKWSRGHAYASGEKPAIEMGRSERYYLENTMSGEWIRILDTYQQFLESPFWKTPVFASELRQRERKVLEARK